MPCVKEENSAVMAAPASTILSGVKPSRPKEPKIYTDKAPTAAPIKEIHINACIDEIDNATAARTTNNVAPALTPSTLGEASGLRVSVCINVPAMARLAPMAAAMHALGTRVVRRMI
ncbi:hypothetical protein D3C85_1392400 [compost metagenome]